MFKQLPDRVETERLLITRFTEAELPYAFELHQIEVVNRYLPYTTWTSFTDAREWFDRMQALRADETSEQYAIKLNSDATFIGTCIVFGFNVERHSAEFGYVLHPTYWQQGLMVEAMDAFTESLANRLNLCELNATVEAPNVASQKLLTKLGFDLVERVTEDNGCVLGKWTKTYSH